MLSSIAIPWLCAATQMLFLCAPPSLRSAVATRRERSAHHRLCDPALPLALQSDPDQRRREHRTRASFARLPDFPDRIQSLSTRSKFYLRDPDVDLPARYHRRLHHLHLDRTSGCEIWVGKSISAKSRGSVAAPLHERMDSRGRCRASMMSPCSCRVS